MNGHALIRYCGTVWLVLALSTTTSWPFQLGIENLTPSFLHAVHIGKDLSSRVGLITNQTGVDQKGNRTVDILRQNGVRIVYILAPEHGFDGKQPAGKPIADVVDRKTGIPIKSVYGRGGDYTIAGKRIDQAIMRQLDVLFFDIQDAGMRHYSYISTLMCALEAAAEHGKPLIVFDRPNPLGPNMEGPLVDPDPTLKSFISIAPIPLRHGMTIGELALFFNKHVLPKPAKLQVVKMKDYTRTIQPPFLANLSPNLASAEAIKGYSFLGLLGEFAPFYTGVGTSSAFQLIMLPDAERFPPYEWSRVKAILQRYHVNAAHQTITYNRRSFTGLKMFIEQVRKVPSFELLLELFDFFKKAGISFTYSRTFDKTFGTKLVKKLCQGGCTRFELQTHVNSGLERFFKQASDAFLYDPKPEIRRLS